MRWRATATRTSWSTRSRREAFRADIRRAKQILEGCFGGTVQGYRAPGFSITPQTPWAWDILAEEGYRYDSSVFASSRSFGGDPNAYPKPHVRSSARQRAAGPAS